MRKILIVDGARVDRRQRERIAEADIAWSRMLGAEGPVVQPGSRELILDALRD